MKYRIIYFLVSCFLLTTNSWADAWQADVKVKSVQSHLQGQDWLCYATVHNSWDDNAREAKAKILVPVGVQVWHAATSNGGRFVANSLVYGNTHSYVTCELGDLGVNQAVEIKVATSMPTNGNGLRCGVFAWSETPDPKHNNNYAVSP